MDPIDLETATLAGGCFWCTEAVFIRLKGVLRVTSGYTGDNDLKPTYARVSRGDTGFVGAIQIRFDPKIVSFGHILDVFWATHDPTTLNRQGNDVGTQYRSVIYYSDQTQKETAIKSKEKITLSGKLSDQVVTAIEPLVKFYPAEGYHQNYYEINKDSNPYCSLVIDPKIEKLLTKFNSEIKEEYLY